MNVEERNEWIVKNQEWLLRKVQSYSDKYGLDFSELYSEASVKLIYYLDQWDKERKGNPSFNDIGMRLCTHLKKYCEKQKEEKEEIPSGMEFEIIWTPEFNSKEIWKESIRRRAKLDVREWTVFCGMVFEGATEPELGKFFGLTKARIGQIYDKACRKVYRYLFSNSDIKYIWEFSAAIKCFDDDEYENGTFKISGTIVTNHNDKREAIEKLLKETSELYSVRTDDIKILEECIRLVNVVDFRRSTVDGHEIAYQIRKRRFYGIE